VRCHGLPLIDQAHATLGAHPRDVLADAGYRSEATFQTLEARGIRAYISLGHEARPAQTSRPSAWRRLLALFPPA
jgi:hypothetical protein